MLNIWSKCEQKYVQIVWLATHIIVGILLQLSLSEQGLEETIVCSLLIILFDKKFSK